MSFLDYDIPKLVWECYLHHIFVTFMFQPLSVSFWVQNCVIWENSTVNPPRGYESDIQNSFWLDLRELRSTVGKLTELWRKSRYCLIVTLTFNQFKLGPRHCGKEPFSENCIQIGASVWLEFCSQTDTHRHTEMKFKPSTIFWRCKKSKMTNLNENLNFDNLKTTGFHHFSNQLSF